MPDLRDTTEARIARLDESLARRGQTVVLRRRIPETETFVSLTVRAHISGYAVDALVSGVKVTDSKFIMSPSEILATAGAWPGAAGGRAWPTVGDFLVVDDRPRRVEQCLPMSFGGVVRIEGRVS